MLSWKEAGASKIGQAHSRPLCIVAPNPDYAPHPWRLFAYKPNWKPYTRPTCDHRTVEAARQAGEAYFAQHFIVWC